MSPDLLMAVGVVCTSPTMKVVNAGFASAGASAPQIPIVIALNATAHRSTVPKGRSTPITAAQGQSAPAESLLCISVSPLQRLNYGVTLKAVPPLTKPPGPPQLVTPNSVPDGSRTKP